MRDGNTKGAFNYCLVQHREMRTLYFARELVTMTGLNIASVATLLANLHSKVIPRAYAFVRKMIDALMVEHTLFYHLKNESGKVAAYVGVPT